MADLGPFETKPLIAVALSGGLDSMLLLALALAWAKARGGQIHALIVDHQLRAGSTDEALLVRDRARALGVAASILTWHHEPLANRLQERARLARYQLLDEACARLDCLHVLVGHHADDQAETVAMRTERRSGVRGLAGMSAIIELEHCRILRPLLSFTRQQIRTTAKALDLAWIDDPSNDDPKFWRGHYRLDGSSTTVTSTHLAGQKRISIDDAINQFLGQTVTIHPLGCFFWTHRAEEMAGPDLVSEVLAILGQALSGQRYRRKHQFPRGTSRGHTFSGAYLCAKSGKQFLLREPARIRDKRLIPPDSRAHWDDRFVIDNRGSTTLLTARPCQPAEPSMLRMIQTARRAMVAATLPLLPLACTKGHHSIAAELIAVDPKPRVYFGTQKALSGFRFVA